jgi:hypothetical protein
MRVHHAAVEAKDGEILLIGAFAAWMPQSKPTWMYLRRPDQQYLAVFYSLNGSMMRPAISDNEIGTLRFFR